MLFHQGDHGDALYVIVTGLVKIYIPSPEGDDALLSILQPGQSFGELSLLDGLPRSATAAAMERTRVLRLPHDAFWEFLREHPSAMQSMVRKLATLVRRERDLLADAVFSDLPTRLAKRLLDLEEQYGTPHGTGSSIQVTLTQGELAQMVGATRVSVNRLLNALRDSGTIDWEGKNLVVLRREELRRMAGPF